MENYTAVMLEPYLLDKDGVTGIPMVQPKLLKDAVVALDDADFQVHFHASGDGAIRQSLNAIQAARDHNDPSDGRHHISHLQIIHSEDTPRFAALDVVANFQPLWACADDYINELTLPFICEETAR
ncbi:MAG: amidohydrolase family protein [Luminiphilus sp.]|nr:amidohydrolase family protein [Luminiphilus sp.]